MMLNPPRRRRRGGKRRKAAVSRRRRSTSVARFTGRVKRYARRHRGGAGGIGVRSLFPLLKEGAFLAAGAVVTTQIYTRFVPDNIKANRGLNHLARVGVALAGGYVVSRFVSKQLGRAFALGGVSSAILIAANDFIGAAVVPLGSLEEAGLGMYYTALGDYYSPGPTYDSNRAALSMAGHTDSLAWESGVPERLDPINR